MTLIELLVVIIILTTIVAAAIPIMAPADEDRRLREASRSLNTVITSAQARAVASKRLYGIGLKRLSQDTNRPEDRAVCVQVYYVEQQPAYAGFDSNSRACLALHPDPSFAAYVLVRFMTRDSTGWAPDLFPTNMIRPGDVIEVGGTRLELMQPDRGDMSNITLANNYYGPPSNGTPQILARPLSGFGQQLYPKFDNNGADIGSNGAQPPYWTSPSPYQIHRQPVTTADEPFQMPEGTAIDLRASGLGYSDEHFFQWPLDKNRMDSRLRDNNDPIMILFTPEGKVARLRYNQKYQPPAGPFVFDKIFDEPVVDNLFLLVGQRGKIPAPALDRDITLTTNYPKETTPNSKAARERAREPINWLSGNSRWIVIGSQSGRIATIANAFVDPAVITEQYTQGPAAMDLSSEPLRSQQIMAARGLTRESTQETAR